MPRSKYPREVAVDYELVYSINKASWVTGDLMKAKDMHMKRILHTEHALRAHRGHPEGTQGHRAILQPMVTGFQTLVQNSRTGSSGARPRVQVRSMNTIKSQKSKTQMLESRWTTYKLFNR